MLNKKEKPLHKKAEEGIFISLFRQFIPYWPLCALLSIGFSALALVYSSTTVPTYKIRASLAINDEQKGAVEASSLNIYASKKTVENEVLVLQSRSVITDVVNELSLYAPVFEKQKLTLASAYTSSPIRVKVKQPDLITDSKQIPFSWDPTTSVVKVQGKMYPLNSWITFPFGTVRFEANPNASQLATGKLSFALVDPRKASEQIYKRLKVNGTGKLATIIGIEYTDEIPKRGVDIINQLLASYNRFSTQAKSQLSSSTTAFIDKRLSRVKAQLDSIENRVQNFRSSKGAIDITQQGKIYLESAGEMARKTTDIDIQLAMLRQVDRYVRSGTASNGVVPTSLGIEDPVLSNLLQQLNTLELRYANLLTTTGENNPEVRSVAGQIAKIRPNVLQIVTNQRSRLIASRKDLQETANEMSAQLRTLPEKERELLNISREQGTMREAYNFLLQKREEAALTNASLISDSRIIDEPEAGLEPSGTGRGLFLLIAFVSAFGLTIGYIVVTERLNSKILFRKKLEESTYIPIIGELIQAEYVRNTPKINTLNRQLNQIQAALGLFKKSKKSIKILITAGNPGEGKTFVTTNLAKSITAYGKKVLVIDLDLYMAGATSSLFGGERIQGLERYIAGACEVDDIIFPTDFKNLYLIPVAGLIENPLSILLHPKLKELLDLLSDKFDVILMDSPPTELTIDTEIIAPYADQILWVVRSGKTSTNTLHLLNQIALENAYIIFNGVQGRGIPRRYYGYGYGYGYDYITATNNYYNR